MLANKFYSTLKNQEIQTFCNHSFLILSMNFLVVLIGTWKSLLRENIWEFIGVGVQITFKVLNRLRTVGKTIFRSAFSCFATALCYFSTGLPFQNSALIITLRKISRPWFVSFIQFASFCDCLSVPHFNSRSECKQTQKD